MIQDEPLEEDDTYYEVSPTPIKDKSMLGRHSQKLCEDLDVHWLLQTCSVDRNSTSKCTVKYVYYVCVMISDKCIVQDATRKRVS